MIRRFYDSLKGAISAIIEAGTNHFSKKENIYDDLDDIFVVDMFEGNHSFRSSLGHSNKSIGQQCG